MRTIDKFAVVCITCFGIFQSFGDVDAQELPNTNAAYSSTQDGITVQLEKVAVDRILNTAAWLKARQNEYGRGNEIAEGLREHLPARLVTFSVSVVGETKTLGVTKIGFVDEKKTVSSAISVFGPPKWQPRLPNLVVDPKANGIEAQVLLSGDTKISEIFPTKIEVKVTAANGKELTFVFDNVTF